MSAGRSLLQLVAAVQAALTDNMTPDGPNDHDTLAALAGLMDCAEQRAAEGQAQQDETDGGLWRFLLRAAEEGTPECALMVGLTEKYEASLADTPDDHVGLFAAHVAEGLALFKAKAEQ